MSPDFIEIVDVVVIAEVVEVLWHAVKRAFDQGFPLEMRQSHG
ncbi:hypothetical protein [uncultured Gimesia sp.]